MSPSIERLTEPDPGGVLRPGAYVIFVSVVAALGGLLFGYDTAVISGTVDALREHFTLEPLRLGWAVGSA